MSCCDGFDGFTSPANCSSGYPSIRKDPSAVKDYSVDWSAWLGLDTIISVVWTVPSGLSIQAESHTDTMATVWLASGAVGNSYNVVCHITTAAGRQDERTFTVVVVDL